MQNSNFLIIALIEADSDYPDVDTANEHLQLICHLQQEE